MRLVTLIRRRKLLYHREQEYFQNHTPKTSRKSLVCYVGFNSDACSKRKVTGLMFCELLHKTFMTRLAAIHPPRVYSPHDKGEIRRLWSNHISESNAAEILPLRLRHPPDFPNRVAPCVASIAILVIVI